MSGENTDDGVVQRLTPAPSAESVPFRSSFPAVAGTVLQVAGMWSICLGVEVYADTDYLSGFVPRALFFACSAVLVVGGFAHWQIRSLRPAYRVIAFLLVLFATLVTAFCVYDQQLFLPGIMLAVAALGKRFAAKSQVIVLSVLALTGFSAFQAIDELVKYHFGVKDAFVPILALVLNGAATYCAFRVARTKPERMSATGNTA